MRSASRFLKEISLGENEAANRINATRCQGRVSFGNVVQSFLALRRVPAIVIVFDPIQLFLDLIPVKQQRDPFSAVDPMKRHDSRILTAGDRHDHLAGWLQKTME